MSGRRCAVLLGVWVASLVGTGVSQGVPEQGHPGTRAHVVAVRGGSGGPVGLDGGGNCPRFAAGSDVLEAKDLWSVHGVLQVTLSYRTRVDADGTELFCFVTEDGAQSPTLHVWPGDELKITLRNEVPVPAAAGDEAGAGHHHSMSGMSGMGGMSAGGAADPGSGDLGAGCAGMVMTASSTNMHFHGANLPPVCHQDEAIRTMVNAGETFEYDLHFPKDEPPGLYWYHPHVHGSAEKALLGGASGAIVVEGLETVNHLVAGLPVRTLVVRDRLRPPAAVAASGAVVAPAWELSVNYVPVESPVYMPAVLRMGKGERQMWRVLNASADTILDVEVRFDGVAQRLAVVGLDGVPTGSEDGTTMGRTRWLRHILLPPGGRGEFVVKGPGGGVKDARLLTREVPAGHDGDNNPERPLAVIRRSSSGGALMAEAMVRAPAVPGAAPAELRFAGLRQAVPVKERKLYFSEVISDPSNPSSPTNFFITVDGATPAVFDPGAPPSVVTTEGAVEDWTIVNRARERHEFHIHQIHFLVLEVNGKPVKGEFRDTIDVPYWTGKGAYPSVKVRMDFRGDVAGDFLYHCHILGHEDGGMMAMIRVLPKP